jgi:hypothetical protein
MQVEEKNGSKGLILLLILMIVAGVYQLIIVPKYLNKEKKNNGGSGEETKTPEELLAEKAEYLYNSFTLTIEEESVFNQSDKNSLKGKLTLYKMSEPLKLYIGFKNIDKKYYTKDGGHSMKEALANASGNYYYSGNYIMTAPVEEKMIELFNDLPIKHQTVTLKNTKFVYNDTKGLYEVWVTKDAILYTEEKVAYKEVVTKGNEIYIYEYVAYTDYKDLNNIKSRTVQQSSIEVIITEDNKKDYLSYMDKYKYTFEKAADGNYYFKSVEYEDE